MTHHNIIWTSQDGQATIDMSGDYTDADERAVCCADARRMALDEMLAQCASPDEYDAILSGTIAVGDHDPVPCS